MTEITTFVEKLAIEDAKNSTPKQRAMFRLQAWAMKQGDDIFPNDMVEKAKKVARWNAKSPIRGLDSHMSILDMIFTVYENIGFSIYDTEREIWQNWKQGKDLNAEFRNLAFDYI